jgi:hypothetical protein
MKHGMFLSNFFWEYTERNAFPHSFLNFCCNLLMRNLITKNKITLNIIYKRKKIKQAIRNLYFFSYKHISFFKTNI